MVVAAGLEHIQLQDICKYHFYVCWLLYDRMQGNAVIHLWYGYDLYLIQRQGFTFYLLNL